MSKRSKIDSLIDPMATSSIQEGAKIVSLKFKSTLYGLKEWFKTAFLYYGNWSFMRADLGLMTMYLFNSPYRISKRFLQKHGASNIYAYGETPIATMDVIVKECGITKQDHLFELGSGRGRICFWLACTLGLEVTGIDNVPEFVERAEKIRKGLGIKNVCFVQSDLLEASYKEATVLYLFGSALDDEYLAQLTKKFEGLKKGTRFITISFPLEDYAQEGSFEILKRFTVSFPWGETDAYYQMKK